MADVTELIRKQYVGLEAELADITPAEGDTFCATDTGNVYHGCSSSWVLTSGVGVKYEFFAADYSSSDGDYRMKNVSTVGSHEQTFTIPNDFNALTSLKSIFIVAAGASGAGKDIDLTSSYGAQGEPKTQHQESDAASTYTIGAQDTHDEIDISGVFTSIAAGDRCGIKIDHKTIGGALEYLGIEMYYT